jgi:hypothetical protein
MAGVTRISGRTVKRPKKFDSYEDLSGLKRIKVSVSVSAFIVILNLTLTVVKLPQKRPILLKPDRQVAKQSKAWDVMPCKSLVDSSITELHNDCG